jgi:hypothetical protein
MESARVTEKPPAVEHVETSDGAPVKGDAAVDAATRGQAMTGYEHLSVMETIKTFRLVTLICVAMAFSAATDGYQIGFVSPLYVKRQG